MKVDYLNPFVEATIYVVTQCVANADIRRGQLNLRQDPHLSAGISTYVGLTGQLRGRVIYDMSKQTAINIATVMNDEPQVGMNNMVRSTINELANMITGNAAIRLSEAGFKVDITPPTFIVGQNTEVYSYRSMGHLIIPIETRCGEITLSISVTDEG